MHIVFDVMVLVCLDLYPYLRQLNLIVKCVKFKNGLSVTLKACDDSAYLIFEIDILTDKVRMRFGDKLEYFKSMQGKKNRLITVANNKPHPSAKTIGCIQKASPPSP